MCGWNKFSINIREILWNYIYWHRGNINWSRFIAIQKSAYIISNKHSSLTPYQIHPSWESTENQTSLPSAGDTLSEIGIHSVPLIFNTRKNVSENGEISILQYASGKQHPGLNRRTAHTAPGRWPIFGVIAQGCTKYRSVTSLLRIWVIGNFDFCFICFRSIESWMFFFS